MSLATLQGIIGVLFAFSFAIFIHELGHFMFAKLFKVKVEAFSIGFGKRLFGFKRGDTDYKICAIPFGGYVKMVGTVSREMEDIIEGKTPVSEEERKDNIEAAVELSAPAPVALAHGIQEEIDALRNKAYWKKLLVFAAGCINNIITAVLIFFLIYFIGYNEPPHASSVIAGLEAVPEQLSPVKAGDRIVSLDGKPVNNFDDIAEFYGSREKAEDFKAPVKVQVQRNSSTITLELPNTAPIDPPLPAGKITAIGDVPIDSVIAARNEALNLLSKDKNGPVDITVQTTEGTTTVKTLPLVALGPWWPAQTYYPLVAPRIDLLIPNLPAEKSGLKSGDVITSINDEPVSSSFQATRILRDLPGQVAHLMVERPAEDKGTSTSHAIDLEVRANPDNPARGQIGVAFGLERTEHVQFGFTESMQRAVSKSAFMVVQYVKGIKRIFGSSFRTIRENLGGPIGISVQLYKVAQSGWFDFFVTFAMFNIILAMTNLLPLPILDGGHILFATIEAIIRRPLPAKLMIGIYNVFMFMLFGLVILISFNDIIMNGWRLIGNAWK